MQHMVEQTVKDKNLIKTLNNMNDEISDSSKDQIQTQ